MAQTNLIRIVLFGAPGAGKGTQAEYLEDTFGYRKISTGDLIRAEVKAGTEIGLKVKAIMEKGELVSDEIIIDMLKKRLAGDDIHGGYIMDGFPRTRSQAEALSRMPVDKEVVIYLKIGDEDVIVRRILSRLTCSSCGDVYNIEANPPKKEGICDECGGILKHRSDDNEETIRQRMRVYRDQTEPVFDFYRGRGALHEIDALDSIEDVFESIKGVLN
jgi:adenylate kinase